jgi:glycosyltransferase involved in cell wall biosynthesis
MRIGIDTTALPDQPVGAGTYIIQLVRALASLETQHEFIIFAHHGKVELFNIPAKDNLGWALGPDKSPARRLIWEQTTLPRLARREMIDVLHSPHYTRPLSLTCRSVVTFHDMTFFLTPQLHTRAKRAFFPNAIRLSARRADALIAVSESTRQDSIKILGIPPGKITTTPLGVDPGYRPVEDSELLTNVRRKYSLPEKFLLYIGAIEPRKNLPVLLEAFSQLLETGRTQDLVLVGRRGWMYEEVFRLIDGLGLKQHVHLTGYVPAKDLPILYNLAQVFVYPSIYEGFGIPPVEAMACGTPVVTTHSSSMIETVGDAGLLTPPGDESALAAALQMLLDDDGLQEQLRQKGLQRAAKYTWEHTARETLNVYERAVKTQ